MRQLVIIAGLLVALVLPTGTRGAEEASPVPCDRFVSGAPPDIECFEVVVPTWHDGRDATTLTLAVAILRTTGGDPAPDPVVYLAGGPGASAISSINLWAGSPLREARDIILVEQRGTLFSPPFLGCPEQTGAEQALASVAVSPNEHVEYLATAVADCRERLVAEGVDLAAYTTEANADDVDLVRQALGIERWNLYGVSYGTRLGLEVLRRHPDSVRSAVLDGLYPPDVDPYRSLAANHERALVDLFAACRADPDCRGRYGDLEPVFWSLVQDLNARPRSLVMPAPGGDLGGELTGDMLIAQIIGSLSSTEALRWVPAQIAALAEGNIAQYELSGSPPPNADIGDGMRFSIECAERLGTIAPDELAIAAASDHPRLATYVARYAEPAICSTWPVAAAGPAAYEPVTSDLPVLLVSGELDPLTPPSWAERAAESLPASSGIVVARGGHGASLFNACMSGVVASFVSTPEREPDASCAADPAAFRTDVALSAAVPRALASARSTVSPPPIGALVIIAAVMLSWLAAAALGLIRGPRGRSIRWWIATAAALGVMVLPIAVGLLVLGIDGGPEADVLLLGLPDWAGWILALPWLIAVLVAAAGVAALLAWIGRRGSRLERVGTTAVALAGAGAVAVMAAYGFLQIG